MQKGEKQRKQQEGRSRQQIHTWQRHAGRLPSRRRSIHFDKDSDETRYACVERTCVTQTAGLVGLG